MKTNLSKINRSQVKKIVSICIYRLVPRSILLLVLKSTVRVNFGRTWKKLIGLLLLTQDPNYLRRFNILLPEKNKVVI